MERSSDTRSGGATSSGLDIGEELLSSGDVARLFGVDPKTVARWADAGRIEALRTLGGHRRYRPDDVEALLGDAGEAGDAPSE